MNLKLHKIKNAGMKNSFQHEVQLLGLSTIQVLFYYAKTNVEQPLKKDYYKYLENQTKVII